MDIAPNSQTSFSKQQKISLLGITLLALVLRLYQLGQESLWFDESLSAFFASLPFNEMIQSMLEEGLQHSPIYYIFLRPFAATGFNEFNLRLLSVLFGVASIPLLALLGRLFAGNRVGLLAAALLAVNPYHIWYSQEVRMYTMLGLVALAAMYYFSLNTFSTPKNRNWLALAFILGIGYNLHHFIFFIPLVQFIFLLATFKHNYNLFRYWAASVLGAGIMLTPWILVVLDWGKFYGASGASGVADPSVDLSDLFQTFANFSIGNIQEVNFFIIIILSFFLIITILGASRFSSIKLLLVIWLLVPPIVTLAISTRVPMYMDRYLIVSFPAFLILVSYGLMNIRQKLYRQIAILAVLGSMLFGVSQIYFNDVKYERTDWRSAGNYLEEIAATSNPKVFTLFWQNLVPLHFYYHGELPIDPLVIDGKAYLPEEKEGGPEETWLILPNQNDTSHQYGHCEPFDDNTLNTDVLEWRNKNFEKLIDVKTFECIRIEIYQ